MSTIVVRGIATLKTVRALEPMTHRPEALA